MTDYQKWLDRIDNLLRVQRDRSLDLISANFTRRELIEMKMMIEVLMEQEPKTGQKKNCDNCKYGYSSLVCESPHAGICGNGFSQWVPYKESENKE